MYLQLKAKHFKDAPYLSMHDCAVSKALNEIYGENVGFNGVTASIGNTKVISRLRKIDGQWKSDPYTDVEYGKHASAAEAAGYGDKDIVEIHFPFAEPVTAD